MDAALPAYIRKFAKVLDALEEDAMVAVITMTGSCCPITTAHCNAFDTARNALLGAEGFQKQPNLEQFSEVLGMLSLNSDKHVNEKMASKHEKSVSYAHRADLVRLASAEVPWMDFNPGREHHVIGRLQAEWPHLQFVRFALNGADDVVKYRKWKGAGPEHRYITIGRPGFTDKVVQGASSDGVALDQGFFILVPETSTPEVADVSSTLVRELLRAGDRHLGGRGRGRRAFYYLLLATEGTGNGPGCFQGMSALYPCVGQSRKQSWPQCRGQVL
ncbi:unnamed protein product [Symbiodinium pilosum]|uniref:Uncharacterized protein n=1 Tax=Symbiodinium pilosum TaxID=2952 RepID=A0A812IU79_SYMPI|nr:unnamed protein product [Symbiodinium pilosum]